eukprot:7391455-Prymnesium_polylepis.1
MLLVTVGGGAKALLRYCQCNNLDKVHRLVRRCRSLWYRAGMRCKLKALCGLYQCIAAVPSVFNLTAPPGVEEFTKWMEVLEFPADFGVDIVVPAACFGSYSRRLWIGATWPFALIVLAAAGFAGRELAQECAAYTPTPRGSHAALSAGLQSSLPLALVLSFIVVPSTATLIFQTFPCITFEYDAGRGLTQRYHSADLEMRRDHSAAEFPAPCDHISLAGACCVILQV